MIKLMDLEYTHMSMEQNMKEIGSVIFKMVLAKKPGLMDQATKEIISKGRNREEVKLLKKLLLNLSCIFLYNAICEFLIIRKIYLGRRFHI